MRDLEMMSVLPAVVATMLLSSPVASFAGDNGPTAVSSRDRVAYRLGNGNPELARLISLEIAGDETEASPASASQSHDPESSDADRARLGPTSGTPWFGSEVALSSAYVWRGFVTTETACLQPEAWFSLRDITISTWLNVEWIGPSRLSLTEHDLTVEYGRELGSFDVSLGWVNYFFPTEETARHSNELFVTVAHAGRLSPAFALYVDPHEGSGVYGVASVGHARSVWGGSVRAAGRVGVGYNHRQWIDESGLSDVNLHLALEVPPLFGMATMEPFLAYSRGFRSEMKAHHFYGGFTIRTR
jgi:hypothetical protein